MDVVSLFNGMGTLRQAFNDLKIPIGKYYSSEIKPAAIELQQYHYPDVIQVGDIKNWREWDINWANVGFIGSGSPCQDLSIAGNRKGLKGDRSSLFYVFVEILNHVKKLNPNVKFLQENVGSAPIEAVGEMSRALGVYPARWNSSLVTAQLRDRYYWTNIKMAEYGMFGDMIVNIPPPQDQGIMFEDIIQDGAVYVDKAQALLESEAKTYGYKDMSKFTALVKRRIQQGKQLPNFVYRKKAVAILESDSRPHNNQESILKRHIEMGMSNCVCENGDVRILNKTELCRLQGFPDDYCDSISRNKAASLLGDGWTLPIITHILSFLGEEKK